MATSLRLSGFVHTISTTANVDKMPRRLGLKGFLRRDLLSRRTRALIPYHNNHNASRTPNLKRESVPDLTFPPRTSTPPNEADSKPTREVDSIFGEPIYTKEEVFKEKFEQLLAEDRKQEQAVRPRCHNPELVKLMNELDTLVKRELEASPEERKLIRNQKLALTKEARKLEAEIKGKRVKSCKVPSDEEATLPEPISPDEKKHIQLMQERASKAILGLEGPRQKKRKRDADDPYELDGEDRLRAGISLSSHREIPLTGRWYSRVHDYFPEPENGVDGAGVLEDLTVEERLTMRRELAEYGEKLAKTARMFKEDERKAGKGWYGK
ncbi:hypothetical protein BGZ57DRAFT_376803 [Hyaloscypha finlandica]|nr:hypothetical protein BGZ57DRAFT_376803 [Hyaloscypha finlandica]